MRILMVLLLASLYIVGNSFAQGSAGQACDVDSLITSVEELVAVYRSGSRGANEAEALQGLQELENSLRLLREDCARSARGSAADSPGSGTPDDPFAFGILGDTDEGFSLRVSGYIGNANERVRRENRFNTRPASDEVYVLMKVEVECHSNSSRCSVDEFDFKMVGNNGTIYDNASIVFDEIDVNIVGGARGEGDVVFLVKKADTDLKLIYVPNMFRDEGWVYFWPMPDMSAGIQISSQTNLNIRSGPGTNFSVVTSLPANSPVLAFGRNSNGTWLQIENGWIFAELVTVEGDIQGLPITAE